MREALGAGGWAGDLDGARRLLAAASASYAAMGARPDLAWTWLDLARVAVRRDAPADARAHLADADSTFRALGIAPGADRAQTLAAGLTLLVPGR